MDLLAAIRIAVRRWYILAPLIVLSMLGSLAVRGQVQPSYEIDGVMPIVSSYVSTQEATDQLNRNSFVDVVEPVRSWQHSGTPQKSAAPWRSGAVIPAT
jgi:hypothetical protein